MNKVLQGYEDLDRNEFWKEYLHRIDDYRKLQRDTIESADVERVPKIQGELSALKWLKNLPSDIVDKFTKSDKGA